MNIDETVTIIRFTEKCLWIVALYSLLTNLSIAYCYARFKHLTDRGMFMRFIISPKLWLASLLLPLFVAYACFILAKIRFISIDTNGFLVAIIVAVVLAWLAFTNILMTRCLTCSHADNT